MESRLSVALVDDDPVFLFEMTHRLEDRGLTVRSFRDGKRLFDTLDRGAAFDTICSDVRMPEMSGLELQQRLSATMCPIPLILFTAHADIDSAVLAIKAGASDFLPKPLDPDRLIKSVKYAVETARDAAQRRRQLALFAERVSELSYRHRQVLRLMVEGMTSKQIASALDINHRTVENYRAVVMEKIGVGSVAQLVRLMLEIERQ